jgi:hypothetical protein
VPGHGKPRKTLLTEDEERTLVTLWAISRSPLFVGANLTELDDETAALLTNKDLVAIDQQGHGQRQVEREGDLVLWTSELNVNRRYLALFNVGETPMQIDRPYNTMGLPKQQFHVREVWTGKVLDTSLGPTAWRIALTIPPHGCALLALSR